MHCPKCKDHHLEPTKLEDGLPVMGCAGCHGVFLSLLHYRDWVEHFPHDDMVVPEGQIETDSNNRMALHCPKCGKIMTKFSVTGHLSNRLDLCSSCDEAWLDSGEWRLLKSLALGDKLPKIFTAQWQRHVREEKMELSRFERLQKLVGDEDAEKADDIRQWLKDNKNKSAIVRFLAAE